MSWNTWETVSSSLVSTGVDFSDDQGFKVVEWVPLLIQSMDALSVKYSASNSCICLLFCRTMYMTTEFYELKSFHCLNCFGEGEYRACLLIYIFFLSLENPMNIINWSLTVPTTPWAVHDSWECQGLCNKNRMVPGALFTVLEREGIEVLFSFIYSSYLQIFFWIS